MPTARRTPRPAKAAVGDGAGGGAAHEHGWRTVSRHPTSMGQVLYVYCAACGVRRVDIQGEPARPPVALSVELEPPNRGATLSSVH